MSRDRVADAEDCKRKGNDALQSKDYDKAVQWYTEAIKLHEDHVYFSNRSAAYLSKGYADSALKDAEKCISMKPDWGKGYSRKGAALHKLKKYDKAIEAYEKGLEIEPDNTGLQQGLEAVVAEKENPYGFGTSSAGSTENSGSNENPLTGMFRNVMDVAARSPKLSQYLSDPSYVSMLQNVQANPQLMQMYMNDPRFMETVSELIGLDPTIMAEAKKQNSARDEVEKKEREKDEAERIKRNIELKKKREEEEFNALPQEEKDKILRKREAQEFKAKGNELYKAKKFVEALEAYDKAIELDDTDMSFFTNKAAVKLEQGELDSCVELSTKAVDVGRLNKADYELIAKAYARIGNAYMKHGKYDKAIEFYNKAQVEQKSQEVDKKLKLCEQKKKETEAAAYIDPEKAKDAKEEGNVKFKAGDFPGAIKDYSEAVKRDPENPVYYNNRAAAYMKLADFGRAMDDCKAAIKLDPKYVKAYSRKGNIELFLKEYHKAMDTFQQGLNIEPENQECKDGLNRTMYAVQSQQGENTEERAKRAMEDPEIRNMMSDPLMRSILGEMQTDPKAAAKHMANPDVAAKIQKLIAAGILQTR